MAISHGFSAAGRARPPQGRVRYPLKTPWRNGTTQWSLSRWSSSPNSRRSCRHRAHISPDSWRLCAERQSARAAHTLRARQTSYHGRGVDWDEERPAQPRREAPLNNRKDPPPSAPSLPTSKGTARRRKRTPEPPRAHCRLWPRDPPPDTTPKAKQAGQHAVATIPQGHAWLAIGSLATLSEKDV